MTTRARRRPSCPAVGNGKHTFEADLIVAADGGRSLIRRRLAPESTVASAGYTAWRAVIPWFRAPKLPDDVAAGRGDARRRAPVPARHARRAGQLGQRHPGRHLLGRHRARRGPARSRRPPSSPCCGAGSPTGSRPVGELLDATEPGDLVQQAGEELRPLPRRFGFPVGARRLRPARRRRPRRRADPDPGRLPGLRGRGHARRPDARRRARAGRWRWRWTSTRGPAGPGWPGSPAPPAGSAWCMQAQGRLAVRARDAALGRLSPQPASSAPPPPPTTGPRPPDAPQPAAVAAAGCLGYPARTGGSAAGRWARRAGSEFGDAGGADAAKPIRGVDAGHVLAGRAEEDQVVRRCPGRAGPGRR